jgi:hypothetical protein
VRDPRVTLRIGGYTKRTSLLRLVGSVIFAFFGALFIYLALSGNAETAPGYQRTLAHWFTRVGVWLARIPNELAWPLLGALAIALVYLVVQKEKVPDEQQETT